MGIEEGYTRSQGAWKGHAEYIDNDPKRRIVRIVVKEI